MPTVLITGAAGFIGAACARRYADAGWQVRGLDLHEPGAGRYGLPAHPQVDYRRGSITDPRVIHDAVQGVDRVIHTAAIVAESGDWATFDAVNGEAPARIARAARDAGARTFVHFSSVMVHGFTFPDGCREDGPLDPADNPYCATKIRSEQRLRGLDLPGLFDVHVIRPGDVYGPGSIPWIVRPIEHMRSRTFLYVDARRSLINHVYIDNLLDAVDTVIAAGAAVSGRPFIVTDGAATLTREFYGWFAGRAGMRWAPALPGWLAEPVIGGLASVLPTRLRERLDLDRESIRYLRRCASYDSSAIRSLGWRPEVDLTEGRERTATWLRAVGLLPEDP